MVAKEFNYDGLHVCQRNIKGTGVVFEVMGRAKEGVEEVSGGGAPELRRFYPSPKLVKIPGEQWDKIVDLFYLYRKKSNSEVTVSLGRTFDRSGWRVVVPEQSVESGAALADRTRCLDLETLEPTVFPPAGCYEGATMHSHGTIGSFFSGTDDRSESGKPGFAVVVGSIGEKSYTVLCSYIYGGIRYYLHVDELVDFSTSKHKCLGNGGFKELERKEAEAEEKRKKEKKKSTSVTSDKKIKGEGKAKATVSDFDEVPAMLPERELWEIGLRKRGKGVADKTEIKIEALKMVSLYAKSRDFNCYVEFKPFQLADRERELISGYVRVERPFRSMRLPRKGIPEKIRFDLVEGDLLEVCEVYGFSSLADLGKAVGIIRKSDLLMEDVGFILYLLYLKGYEPVGKRMRMEDIYDPILDRVVKGLSTAVDWMGLEDKKEVLGVMKDLAPMLESDLDFLEEDMLGIPMFRGVQIGEGEKEVDDISDEIVSLIAAESGVRASEDVLDEDSGPGYSDEETTYFDIIECFSHLVSLSDRRVSAKALVGRAMYEEGLINEADLGYLSTPDELEITQQIHDSYLG